MEASKGISRPNTRNYIEQIFNNLARNYIMIKSILSLTLALIIVISNEFNIMFLTGSMTCE